MLEACPTPTLPAHLRPRAGVGSEAHPDDLVIEELADGTRQVFIHSGGSRLSWARSRGARHDPASSGSFATSRSPHADRVLGTTSLRALPRSG